MPLPKFLDSLPLPPIVRTIGDLTWSRRFLIFLAAYGLIGFALYQLPQHSRNYLCRFYKDNYQNTVASVISRQIALLCLDQASASTQVSTTGPIPDQCQRITEQAIAAVNGLIYSQSSDVPDGWHAPTVAEAKLVAPGAFVLALLTVLLLPQAASARRVKEETNNALDQPGTGSGIGHVRPLSKVDDLMRARALRLAVSYSILSCVVVSFVRPDFGMDPTTFALTRKNVLHVSSIAVAAIAASLYVSYGFAKSRLQPFEIGVGIAVRGIFFGGLIAVCIALPYQLLRPKELQPIGEEVVVFVLVFRLIVLPFLSGVATTVMALLVQRSPV